MVKSSEPERLPRPRMSLEDRAKIFVPFDPLHGFREALRAKEREVESAALDERGGFDPLSGESRSDDTEPLTGQQ